MSQKVTGYVERITYHHPDSGFLVIRVQLDESGDVATLVGKLLTISEGEQIEAEGTWVSHPKYGPQFQSDTIRIIRPTSVEGIRRYLASGVIRGIGPKLANRIVKHFKEETLRILDDYPEMLRSISGIGKKNLKMIRESWKEQQGVRDIMIFLQNLGFGPQRAARIFRVYGNAAIELIEKNPYRLIEDVYGIGFATADKLAKELGIAHDSPYRIRAAIIHTMQEFSSAGHCGYPVPQLMEWITNLASLEDSRIEEILEQLIQEKKLVKHRMGDGDWMFLQSLYQAELKIAARILRLLDSQFHPLNKAASTPKENSTSDNFTVHSEQSAADDSDTTQQKSKRGRKQHAKKRRVLTISQVESKIGIELAEEQKQALELACENKVLVITGGPGVGKTTLVQSLITLFESYELKCVLTAPTGRAAKRLTETTHRPAKTIHRLLVYDPVSHEFLKNDDDPLKGDLFVIDESSMLDVQLCSHLLDAIPWEACVVFVGDIDQLPSVGPGRVLADMIQSEQLPVVRLTKIFRQESTSRIITAAYDVNQGQMPLIDPPESGLTDFYFVQCETPDDICQMMIRLIQERIPQKFHFDPMTEIQVLTPMNKTVLGAKSLNETLQEAMNPARGQNEVTQFGRTFREGDRVIQIVNNYNKEVFNGDLGIILDIDEEERELRVDVDGRQIEYEFQSLEELSLAYALTIHKSQGSEYPCVIIPLHTQHFVMLQRNLLYTAITRGKQLVILVGTTKALHLAVSREDTSQRYTALKDRLQDRSENLF